MLSASIRGYLREDAAHCPYEATNSRRPDVRLTNGSAQSGCALTLDSMFGSGVKEGWAGDTVLKRHRFEQEALPFRSISRCPR